MNDYLNSILNAFEGFVFISTDEGIFSDIQPSDVGEDSFFPRENFIGKHYSDVVSPDLQLKIEEAYRHLRKGKDRYNFEFSIEKKEEVFWFTAVVSNLSIKGKPHYLGVVRNFTARKNHELFIRGILDNSVAGIITFRALRNSDGKIVDFRIIEINETGQKLLGVLEEEALEMSMLKSLSGERRDEMLKKYMQVTETGKTANFTYLYTNKKGSTFWFKSSVAKYMDGVVVTTQDITEQRNREAAFRESEKKYQKIFRNIRDVFYRTDINGIVVDISPSIERYTDFKREEIIGKPVIDFYHNTEDREKLIENLRMKGEVIDFEVRLKKKMDTLAFASVNAHLVFDESGKIEGIEGYMRDISERKKTEEQLVNMNEKLRELNQQKDKLFSVIAHDLKNAIFGAAGLSNIMVDEFESLPKDEMYEYVSLLKKNMDNSSELLNDLLSWAGNQFREVSINPEKLNLFDVTLSVFEMLKEGASKKMITLENKVPDQLFVHADLNILKIILRNLISNSIKFSNAGSSITVSAIIENEMAQIATKDRGIGMEKEVLKKIFTKSIYHSTSGTKGEKGSGLGLELCQIYIKKLKGEIWAESEPGAGSTFYFTIPLSAE